MKAVLALLALVASGCAAGTAQPPMLVDDPFMATFEDAQRKGGEAAGVGMLSSFTDESGDTKLSRAVLEPMDQMIHIWGPDHPAVPIFFSTELAIEFAILEAHAVEQRMSEQEAQAWAWKTMHERRKPGAQP